MCCVCYDNVARLLPKVPEDKRHELLMNATCFCFGSIEEVEKQLAELAEKTDGTFAAAMNFVEAEMFKPEGAA